MLLGKVISTITDKYRQVKTRLRGSADVRTPYQIAPFGDDSNPVADTDVVYLRTANMNDPGYIIGCRLKDPLAAVGEKRLFSTDADGAEQTRVWLKSDGKINLGGTGASDNPNHAAQYEGLRTAFNQLRTDFNNLVTLYNAHTHVYSPGPGTPTPTAGPVAPGTISSADITTAKIDKLLVL